MPNTPIIGDPKYRVLNPSTLEVHHGQGWTRYTKCTADTNPVLDYSTMPAQGDGSHAGNPVSEPDRENLSPASQRDPHRPPCTGVSCEKIRVFLKEHYCGEAPFGNGPDDSCDLRDRRKPSADVKEIADYSCEWNENTGEAHCEQQGQVPSGIRRILVHKLEESGMPAKAPGETLFRVWESARTGWLLTEAYYSHHVGDDIELSEVIAIVDRNARVTILRKLPFKKTDVDVPEVTDWTLLDIADTRGTGELDVILEGDAYEDHWLEVIRMKDGRPKTIFSGLGYYL